MAIKVLFLSYSGRSGSTLLADRIAREIDDVIVLPELRSLEFILGIGLSDSSQILSAVHSDQQLRQFVPLSALDDFAESVRVAQANEGAVGVCTTFARVVTGREPSPDSVLVLKMGAAVFSWNELKSALGEAGLIYVHRHPCGVASSQLSTQRAYGRSGNMGRSDPWHCARVWNIHTSAALAIEDSILIVSYEAVIDGHAISQVTDHFELRRATVPSADGIQLADREKQLHKRLSSAPERSRLDGWQSEMPLDQQRTVGHLCRENMKRLGYDEIPEPSRLEILRYGLVHLRQTILHQATKLPQLVTRPAHVARHARLRMRRYGIGAK